MYTGDGRAGLLNYICLTISLCTKANPNPSMPVPHPRSRMEVPGPASPLSRADSTIEDVKCTDVGYCSSSIFGLGNTRFGKEERHDSRCFSFMLNRNDGRGLVTGDFGLVGLTADTSSILFEYSTLQ